jgi:hypothetical protein
VALAITCPACNTASQFADALRGRKAFCPRCGQALVVPTADAANAKEGLGAGLPRSRRKWQPRLLVFGVLLLLGDGLALGLLLSCRESAGRPAIAQQGDKPETAAKQSQALSALAKGAGHQPEPKGNRSQASVGCWARLTRWSCPRPVPTKRASSEPHEPKARRGAARRQRRADPKDCPAIRSRHRLALR